MLPPMMSARCSSVNPAALNLPITGGERGIAAEEHTLRADDAHRRLHHAAIEDAATGIEKEIWRSCAPP